MSEISPNMCVMEDRLRFNLFGCSNSGAEWVSGSVVVVVGKASDLLFES